MAAKLTDRIVKALPVPPSGKRITYDTEIAGFGVRVYSSGARTFVLRYSTAIKQSKTGNASSAN